MLCIAALVLVRRYRFSLPLIAAYLLALRLLREPYLTWVHGPDSPGPGLQ